MRGGRLPDVPWLSRALYETGAGATLRGVEAEVVGRLEEADGQWLLRLSHTDERVRLAPLRRKVQWDVAAKREARPTAEERSTYRRLRARWRQQSDSIRIVGPLAQPEGGGPVILQVRAFTWNP